MNTIQNIKNGSTLPEEKPGVPIYPEDVGLGSIGEAAASKLLTHLQKIEEGMKKDNVWSPVQTESDTRFMPLPEWITLVMVPRDTMNLEKLLLPGNYCVGGMAAYEQKAGAFPNLSPELMKLFEEYEEMLANLRKI